MANTITKKAKTVKTKTTKAKAKNNSKSTSKKELITKDMTLGEVIGLYPDAAVILMEEGIHCVGCGAANWETIEQGLTAHGKSEAEINAVVKQLNNVASKTEDRRNPDSIVLTDEALKEIKNLLKSEKKTGYGLRIEISSGGCCGTEYKMDFDKEKRAGDTVIEVKGLKVFVDKKSMSMLKGAVVDYINSPMGTGFKIDNPNVQQSGKSCSC